MKKSLRLFVTGSVQGIFYDRFIKENSEKLGVNGYLRKLDDGRAELFIEGDEVKVDEMVAIAKRGSQHAQIRNVIEKPESFQGFTEFKVLKI